jgi:hypothetical protein
MNEIEEGEADMVAIVIEKATIMIEKWASEYEGKKYYHQILVSMVLDRLLSYQEHFLVIRDIYLKGVEKQVFNDPWLEGIARYYSRIWLGDFTAKKLPKGFFWQNVFYVWNSKKGELEQIGLENAGSLIKDYQKWQESFGPVGVVSDAELSQTGRIWRENVPRNVIFGFMEFFKKKEWVFKIVDKTKETGEQTQEEKRSKRSEARGKKCGNYPLKDLRDIMKNVGFKVDSSSIGTICNHMEYHLRLKDLESKSKRWMLTSLEVLLANM